MAFCFEMVCAIIRMGAPVCSDDLCCSGKLPAGRSGQTPASGNGLRDFCRNWHRGNGNRWNGIFGESTNIGRVCSLVVILLGLIGLKLFSDAVD